MTQDFEWSIFFQDKDHRLQRETRSGQRNSLPGRISNLRYPVRSEWWSLKDICEQGCKHYIEHFPRFPQATP